MSLDSSYNIFLFFYSIHVWNYNYWYFFYKCYWIWNTLSLIKFKCTPLLRRRTKYVAVKGALRTSVRVGVNCVKHQDSSSIMPLKKATAGISCRLCSLHGLVYMVAQKSTLHDAAHHVFGYAFGFGRPVRARVVAFFWTLLNYRTTRVYSIEMELVKFESNAASVQRSSSTSFTLNTPPSNKRCGVGVRTDVFG